MHVWLCECGSKKSNKKGVVDRKKGNTNKTTFIKIVFYIISACIGVCVSSDNIES